MKIIKIVGKIYHFLDPFPVQRIKLSTKHNITKGQGITFSMRCKKTKPDGIKTLQLKRWLINFAMENMFCTTLLDVYEGEKKKIRYKHTYTHIDIYLAQVNFFSSFSAQFDLGYFNWIMFIYVIELNRLNTNALQIGNCSLYWIIIFVVWIFFSVLSVDAIIEWVLFKKPRDLL